MGEHAAHPAYSSPGLAASTTREFLTGPGREMGGDSGKVAGAIYEIAHSENVGLRVPLGLDAIAGNRGPARVDTQRFRGCAEVER